MSYGQYPVNRARYLSKFQSDDAALYVSLSI
jgi:hypothetical protein